MHLQLEAAIKEGGERSTEASSVVDFIVALADFDLFSQMMRDVARQAAEEEKAAQAEKRESTVLSSETATVADLSSSSTPSWSGSSSS